MGFTEKHRNAAQLTGVAKGTFDAVFNSSIIAQYLPAKEEASLNFEFVKGQPGVHQAASYRAYDTESNVGVVKGSEAIVGKLPPMSTRLHVNEFAQLTQIGGDIGAKFEDYARTISAGIATRLIQAGSEAIATGKTKIEERNLTFEIDYGRKAELTSTASKLWSDPDADPIADLIALRNTYKGKPGAIHIPENVLYQLTGNKSIIAAHYGRSGNDLPARINFDQVIGVIAGNNFNVITSNEKFIDTNGVEQVVFGTKQVLFLPQQGGTVYDQALGTGALGDTLLGVTAEALKEPRLNGVPGIVAGALEHDDPAGFNVLVSALAVPVVRNANATASLKVLA